MVKKTYSITDLEHLTGLSRRTIHFYIQEKLIPPSEGAGGTAHYTEEHVLRLLLVKQMQKSHLKLSGIREALAGLSLDEMRDLSRAEKKRPSHKWDRAAIRTWLLDETKEAAQVSVAENMDIRYSLRKLPPADNERSWERFEIAEGVEMNVRSDIAHENEAELKAIVEKLRRIIKGGVQ